MRLYIETDAWHKIQHFVDACKTEISGLGKIRYDHGDFIVTDVRIFEQDVSGAHSDIEAEALAKFQCELLRDGENPADWTLWWHSHANMDVFFSGRDIATIDESTDFRYMVSLVTNHKHDLLARVDAYEPFRAHEELDVTLLLPEVPKKVAKACDKEISDKVREKKVTYSKVKNTKHQSGFGFGAFDDDDVPLVPVKRVHKPVDDDAWFAEWNEYVERRAELECEIENCLDSDDTEGYAKCEKELAELERDAREKGFTN